MARPVVHFEVIGKDPHQLRRYYRDLFGWTCETPSPVANEVSDTDSYGFIDLITGEDGTGIRGGGLEEARATRATRSSTLASRMSKPRFSGLNAWAGLA